MPRSRLDDVAGLLASLACPSAGAYDALMRGRMLTSHAEQIARHKWRLVVNLPTDAGGDGVLRIADARDRAGKSDLA